MCEELSSIQRFSIPCLKESSRCIRTPGNLETMAHRDEGGVPSFSSESDRNKRPIFMYSWATSKTHSFSAKSDIKSSLGKISVFFWLISFTTNISAAVDGRLLLLTLFGAENGLTNRTYSIFLFLSTVNQNLQKFDLFPAEVNLKMDKEFDFIIIIIITFTSKLQTSLRHFEHSPYLLTILTTCYAVFLYQSKSKPCNKSNQFNNIIRVYTRVYIHLSKNTFLMLCDI